MAKAVRPNLDSVTTINQDGSRFFLHPADVRGWFTRGRRVVAVVLIAVYVALPWIPINGNPAVFIDVAHRRFHFFGLTVAPQDLWLGFFLISGLGFALFFLTALLGRIWCGWACPQTVFLEHVFRRVERWIDGDAPARRKLDAAPWTGDKIGRRILKHGLFVLLSAAIAHIFLSYFVSLPGLWGMMTSAPLENLRAFLFVFLATAVLYFNFAWFREQLCIVICPYGRFQSALIDADTMTVGYDVMRGEPRGKRRKAQLEDVVGDTVTRQGDCIDCHRCVQVCPTGIDIRNGLQMECVGCANCIDACDEIMDRVGQPRGLIRYDSTQGLEGKPRRLIRPRIILYAVLGFIGAGAALFSFSHIEPAGFFVNRMPGPNFYVTDDVVRNQFQVRVVNKSTSEATYELAVAGLPEGAFANGTDGPLVLPGMGEVRHPIVVSVERAGYSGGFPLSVTLSGDGLDTALRRKVEFIGPSPRLLQEEAERRTGEAVTKP